MFCNALRTRTTMHVEAVNVLPLYLLLFTSRLFNEPTMWKVPCAHFKKSESQSTLAPPKFNSLNSFLFLFVYVWKWPFCSLVNADMASVLGLSVRRFVCQCLVFLHFSIFLWLLKHRHTDWLKMLQNYLQIRENGCLISPRLFSWCHPYCFHNI